MVYTMHNLTISIDVLTVSLGLGVTGIFMLGLMLMYRQLKCDPIIYKYKVIRYLPMVNLIILLGLLFIIGIDIIY